MGALRRFVYETTPDYERVMKHLGLLPPYDKHATREAITSMPCLFVPGSSWHYGTNQDWLTLVVQNVSGLSLDDYEQKHIFAPLGIEDMGYKPNPDRVGMSYTAPEGEKRLGYSAEGSSFPSTHSWGGTGLSGSPRSYLKVLRMLLRGGLAPDGVTRLLREETVELMFQPHLKSDAQREDLQVVGTRIDPFARSNGGLFPGADWGYGGILAGEGYPSGRSKGALSWSGYAVSPARRLLLCMNALADPLRIRTGNVLGCGQSKGRRIRLLDPGHFWVQSGPVRGVAHARDGAVQGDRQAVTAQAVRSGAERRAGEDPGWRAVPGEVSGASQ